MTDPDTFIAREIARQRTTAFITFVVLSLLCAVVTLWASGRHERAALAALFVGGMFPLIGFAGWVTFDLTFNKKKDDDHAP